MTANISKQLSYQFRSALQRDPTLGFQQDFPNEEVENYVRTVLKGQSSRLRKRGRVGILSVYPNLEKNKLRISDKRRSGNSRFIHNSYG
jgi:hypothetical protein